VILAAGCSSKGLTGRRIFKGGGKGELQGRGQAPPLHYTGGQVRCAIIVRVYDL
jgi:hypothetical protein